MQSNNDLNLSEEDIKTIEKIQEITSRIKNNLSEIKNANAQLNDSLEESELVVKSIGSGIQNNIKGVREGIAKEMHNLGNLDLKKFSKNISNLITKYKVQMQQDIMRNFMVGSFGYNSSEIGGIFGKLLGQHKKGFEGFFRNPINAFGLSRRDIGGHVNKRTPYIVGEKGPELFVPESNGSIAPNIKKPINDKNIVINLNINTNDVDNFKKSQNQIISDALRQANAKFHF